MQISKAWNWKKADDNLWLKPCEESYFFANCWKEKGFKTILDFGCGLGRHSIFFAKQGFNVSSFDLSPDGTKFLQEWAEKENLKIDIINADMHNLPYKDNSFDAIFSFLVISHTDSIGIKKIIEEISRILKPNGEIFFTLCSKETWSFNAGFPKIDENTVLKTNEGPEENVPHFYVNLDEIFDLLKGFEIEGIRHVDNCYFAGKKTSSKHFYITALNKKEA